MSKQKSDSLNSGKVVPTFNTKLYSCNDTDVRGILGVEYVIKILKSSSDTSPRYECGLCELVLDSFAMQCHLEGYNHRLKFCEKHFPTAIRYYRQFIQGVLPERETFKVMTPILSKLSIAIEQHHGRNLPYECLERDFSLNRHQILAKAFSCRHASEQYGPTFTHVLDSNEIGRLINERHNYKSTTASRTAIFDSISPNNGNIPIKTPTVRDRHMYRNGSTRSSNEPTADYNINSMRDHLDDTSYKPTRGDFHSESRPRGYRKRKASPPHTKSQSKRRTISPTPNSDILISYKQMVDQQICELTERFAGYRNNPESYPSYSEEWQKFWKRRKDELIIAGLDYRVHNYQPEWISYIKERLDALFFLEVENIKKQNREYLDLAMSNGVSDSKYHEQSQLQSPKITADLPNRNGSTTTMRLTTEPMTVSKTHIVSVLRLMTAFEQHLGSLGPKLTALLSKALQVRENDRTLLIKTLFSKDNLMLIETANEKLKGLILAGLLDSSTERAVENIVVETDTFLSFSHQLSTTHVVQTPACNNWGSQKKSYPQPQLSSNFTSTDSRTSRKELSQLEFKTSAKYIPSKSKTLSDTLSELMKSSSTFSIGNLGSTTP